MASPEREHRVSQLRHDVDDVYDLLSATDRTVSRIAVIQRQHGNRLDELQTALDFSLGRLDRLEAGQREQSTKLDAILAVLRGQPPIEPRPRTGDIECQGPAGSSGGGAV